MRCERVALEASRNRLLGVTEAEVGDVVKFAVADVGGELRGVETLRAGRAARCRTAMRGVRPASRQFYGCART